MLQQLQKRLTIHFEIITIITTNIPHSVFQSEKPEITRKQSTDSKCLNLCLLVIQIHLSPVLPHKGLKKTSLLPAIGYSHSQNCLNEFMSLASAHKIIIFLFFAAHMSGGSSLNIFPSLGQGQELTYMVNPA